MVGRETGHQGPWAGAAQWAGGGWGALHVRKAGQSFSSCQEQGDGCASCRLSSTRLQGGRGNDWGCAELLQLPAGHRMRASLLPHQFRLWLSRMEEQVAWRGRDTGTDRVILNLVPVSGAVGSWGFGWSLAENGAGWVMWTRLAEGSRR